MRTKLTMLRRLIIVFPLSLSGCLMNPDLPDQVVENEAPLAQTEDVVAQQPSQEEQPQRESAAEITLQPNYPQTYTVVKGDTLWDIAKFFLEDPWRWPEVWENNPDVSNPHLIYPGDVLHLHFVGDQPVISKLERSIKKDSGGRYDEGLRYVKLSPTIRTTPLSNAISTIPTEIISPFLKRPRILSQNELNEAPYVLSNADGRLISTVGNQVYVRPVKNRQVAEYTIVRRGNTYLNPEDDEDILGFEVRYIGRGAITRLGDPATVQITHATDAVLSGDLLVSSAEQSVDHAFQPRAPENQVTGQIISVVDGITQVGQYQIVVIDLGRQTGLEPGHTLSIMNSGRMIEDKLDEERPNLKLPDERSGTMMIFRVFDRLSYAMIMESVLPLRVGDRVTNPQ